MNSEFCIHCGTKNIFEIKPKFCSACGEPFNQSNGAVTTPTASQPVEQQQEVIPNINKLECETDFGGSLGFKFGSAIGSDQKDFDRKSFAASRDGFKGDNAIEQTMQECSKNRPPTEIG